MPGDIHHIYSSNNSVPPHDASTRRLAAIVAGDISGYSRLMQIDEEGTYARVRRIQREVIEPTIAEHHGKLVNTSGDGFVAIFDSPVEAVRCGIIIQQNMVGRNASLPREHWILYRIGVNLGDVIIEAHDVFGDGVNIAARLEGIANPGEIYISGGIYEQVKHKLVCGYQSLGDRQVKNITDPVRVYRVLPDPAAFTTRRRWNLIVPIVASSLVLLAFAAGIFWNVIVGEYRRIVARPQTASVSTEVAKAPAEPSPPAAQPSPPATAGAATSPIPVPPPPPPVTEPDMVSLPGGSFAMGSNDDASEKPIHRVTVKPFSISKFPITVRNWNDCVAEWACVHTVSGKDDAPVTDINWHDAKQFVAWLAKTTGKAYRLPSEAEWEYAARGGSQARYWWGDQFQSGMVNCKGCSDVTAAEQPLKVGSFKPNPFGLYDMGGGVDQWVEDCWHKNYQGAPADGSAWLDGDCASRVIRSGSWRNDARYARPANRDRYDAVVRYPTHGFRVALSR